MFHRIILLLLIVSSLSCNFHRKKKRISIFGYFRVFKEYPQKSQIWKSETSPNLGSWLGIPWLGLVSLCQIWDFYGYSLNTLKYPKMGICYFFLCLIVCLWRLFSSFMNIACWSTKKCHAYQTLYKNTHRYN